MKNVIFLKMWNKLWKFCGKSRKFTTNRGTPKNLEKKPSKFTKIRGTFQKKYSKIYSWEIVGNPKKSPKNVKVSFHLLWKYCCLYEHFHVVTQQRNLISLNKDSQNRISSSSHDTPRHHSLVTVIPATVNIIFSTNKIYSIFFGPLNLKRILKYI